MANTALVVAEAALRARKLDRTLTTALPAATRGTGVAATDLDQLDACLRGGLPRGQLCEIVGTHSSGRTTAALQVLAAATQRGEIVALVDAFDRLDVASAAAAAIDLDRLLWIRGTTVGVPASPLPPNSSADRVIERALKALNLVLQAGGFGVVLLDLADAPIVALNRIPFTTWLRLQRTVEGSETVCLLLAPHPIARSAGGLTLTLGAHPRWEGSADRSRRLTGLDLGMRVVSPRRQVEGEVACSARL
jgi:hypothetical protein